MNSPSRLRPSSTLRACRFAVLTAALLAAVTLPAQFQRGEPRRFPTGPEQFVPPPGIKLIADVNYRSGSDYWRIDLLVPEAPSATPRPVIINIHGGGWSNGDKYAGRVIASHWAAQGYVAASVRYRLLGEAPFPACVEDVKSAIRFLRAHAKDYNLDPDRIGVFGHSAGAHLAACLGVIPAAAGLEVGENLEQSSVVNAVCAIATPTNLAEGRELARFGDDHATARKISPVNYATKDAPPYLLIHGTEDRTVPLANASSFIAALRAAGAKNANLVILDGLGHDPMISHEAILQPMVDAFFATTIGPRAGAFTYQIDLARRWMESRAQGFGLDRIADMDENHDGKIQWSEWKGSAEMFGRLDRGTDNVITEEEMLRFKRDGAPRRPNPAPANQP